MDPFYKKIDSFYFYDPKNPQILKTDIDFIEFDETFKFITFTALKDNLGINTVVTKVYEKIDLSELMFEPLKTEEE